MSCWYEPIFHICFMKEMGYSNKTQNATYMLDWQEIWNLTGQCFICISGNEFRVSRAVRDWALSYYKHFICDTLNVPKKRMPCTCYCTSLTCPYGVNAHCWWKTISTIIPINLCWQAVCLSKRVAPSTQWTSTQHLHTSINIYEAEKRFAIQHNSTPIGSLHILQWTVQILMMVSHCKSKSS